MGRKRIIDSKEVSNVNLDDYKDRIVEITYPVFDGDLFYLYCGGELDKIIENFEGKFGDIEKIYWDKSGSIVAITGSNVIPHSERVGFEDETDT